MKIRLNGQDRECPDQLTLEGLLSHCKVRPEMTVIELNKEIIRRGEYGQVELKDNDVIELVTMMGGG